VLFGAHQKVRPEVTSLGFCFSTTLTLTVRFFLKGDFSMLHDENHSEDTNGGAETRQNQDTVETPTSADAPGKTKRVMRIENPIVQACMAELFRFQSLEQITTRLRNIRRQFVCVDGDELDSVMLWIHGFQVTPGEENQGFVGHFACIAAKTLSDGALTLSLTKVPMPLSDHPHKKRPKQPHPNGAHPIMRRINKGHIYATEGDATCDLASLHAEFPDVSIPASPEKLYIIIYDRSEKNRGPVRKVVMRVVPVDSGDGEGDSAPIQGYKIIIKDNKRTSGGGKGTQAMAALVAQQQGMSL
jgi:hypothetical protein